MADRLALFSYWQVILGVTLAAIIPVAGPSVVMPALIEKELCHLQVAFIPGHKIESAEADLDLLMARGNLEFALAPDAGHQIGAAARLVHKGCAKVLREHFSLEAVRSEPEGSRITLPAGFDAAAVRLTGNVVGQPPYAGSLSHRGWRVTEVRLPQLAERHDARVIAPAEVEL